MERSKIGRILLRALKEIARLGQQGSAIAKALLPAMTVAAKVGQQVGEEAEEDEDPAELAIRVAEAVNHCFGLLTTKISARRSAIWEKDHEVKELEKMLEEVKEWVSPLKQSLEDGAEFVFSEEPSTRPCSMSCWRCGITPGWR